MHLNVLFKASTRWRRCFAISKIALVMQLTGIILLAACLQVSATALGQKVTIVDKQVSLKKIFKEIRRQTDYNFIYSNKAIREATPVSIDVKNTSVNEVLNEIFTGQPLTYTIEDKIIIVKRKPVIPHTMEADQVQPDKEITGVVRDSTTGQPLAGVTIKVKGENRGTVTDAGGKFSLEVPEGAVLEVSSVGYSPKQIPVGGKNNFIISLSVAATGLNQLVVVGYGTQKKENLTGAVSEVTSKDLTNRPVQNVTLALQGTMPGITVQNSTGQPGRNDGVINIRGIGTLNNSNPMVVVDGVISSINDVNPNDIESISVLKDAASSAIYGSRAANGVILITTKRGKTGELKIHYKGYIGKQTPTRLPDFVPSWQQAQLYNQVQQNEGRPVKYTKEDIEKFKSGKYPDEYPNTNWLDLFYQGSGIQQNHYIDFSGGSDKVTYMFSLGYFDQEGIVRHSSNNRYTTRLNLTMYLGERLTVGSRISYTRESFEEPTNPYTGDFGQVIRQINRIGRNVPYKYSNGYYGYIGDGNPMAWLDEGSKNENNSHQLVGTVDADLKIVEGLHLKPLLSYRLDINKSKEFIKDIQYYDHKTGYPTFYQGPTSLTNHNDFNNVITIQALLDYKKIIGYEHNIHALIGYSQEYTYYNYLEGFRQGFLNNQISELNAGPMDGQKSMGASHELALQSVFGRINYNFKSKYLLEANLRYDGSSRFSQKNRWGLFPSVSAGWNISEENFFTSLKGWFYHLKLRASWGELGNQNIGSYYPYISTITAGQDYNFNGNIASGIAPTKGANENIKWETTRQTDMGADMGFFQEKLNLSVDYFIKNTNNILLAIPVGASYGLNAPVQNAGAVRNKGWEFTLGYQNKAGAFSYGLTGNASVIKNEVTDLHGTGPIINGYRFMKEGYPIQSYYGYISEGIFQTQEQVERHAKQSGGPIAPGDLIYKDLNDDNVIDGKDRTYLGSYFPRVTYGLNATLNWKGIDLAIRLQGAAAVKGFVSFELLGQPGDAVGKATSILLQAWTPENHSTTFPRLWSSYTQNEGNTNPSSFWIRDASYLRFKNLQVGYTFPDKWTKGIGIEHARVYYSGQNILTLTPFYKWVDPETEAKETGRTYPQVLVNSIGIDLTF